MDAGETGRLRIGAYRHFYCAPVSTEKRGGAYTLLTAALTSQGRLFIRLFIVSTGGDEGVRAGVEWSGESDSREKSGSRVTPGGSDGPERSFSLNDFARITPQMTHF